MAFKVFLDVNIVVDFFVAARSGHRHAISLIDLIEDGSHFGYISETVVNTTQYLIRKSIHAEQFRIAMDEFVSIVTVLPCTNHIIHEAYKRQSVDLEDAVLYQLAFENNLDYFLTSDLRDFKKIQMHALPVLTTERFLSIVES